MAARLKQNSGFKQERFRFNRSNCEGIMRQYVKGGGGVASSFPSSLPSVCSFSLGKRQHWVARAGPEETRPWPEPGKRRRALARAGPGETCFWPEPAPRRHAFGQPEPGPGRHAPGQSRGRGNAPLARARAEETSLGQSRGRGDTPLARAGAEETGFWPRPLQMRQAFARAGAEETGLGRGRGDTPLARAGAPRRQASGHGTAVRLPSNRPWVGMRHDGGREATWKRRRPGSGSARGPKGTPPKPRDAGGGPGHRSLVARGGFPARCPGPSGGRGASGLGDPSRAPRGAPRRGAAIPGAAADRGERGPAPRRPHGRVHPAPRDPAGTDPPGDSRAGKSGRGGAPGTAPRQSGAPTRSPGDRAQSRS